MAGKPGRSGRRTRYQEVELGNLENVCTAYLLNNFESFSEGAKQRIALQICSKAVPQKIDSTVSTRDITKEESDKMRHFLNNLRQEISRDRAADITGVN